MNDGMAGRLIVVTGCAQGIGRALCLAAASAGMRVVGLDINVEGGEETVEHVVSAGGEAWFYPCDVSRPSQIEDTFTWIDRVGGSIDVLVNNAAVVIHAPPEDMRVKDWERTIAVNLTGQAFAAKQAGRSMIAARNSGAIINMTSIAGMAALGRGNFAYSVAKAGIIGMTRELAVEWAPYGIRVNAVAPSQVSTEGFRTLVGNPNIAGGNIREAALRGVPLGRLAEPADVVSAVMFLASDEAAFITGVVLPVDGGSLALHAGGTVRPREDPDL